LRGAGISVFHSIEFSRYSKYNPIIRTNINYIIDTMIKMVRAGVTIIKRISRIISVSKIKKIIPTKKN